MPSVLVDPNRSLSLSNRKETSMLVSLPTLIATALIAVDSLTMPRVACDRQFKYVDVVYQDSGGYCVWERNDGAWSASFGTDVGYGAGSYPDVDEDDSGNLVIVWQQNNSSSTPTVYLEIVP